VTRVTSAPCATGDSATRKRAVSHQVSAVMFAIKPGGDVIREVGHPVPVTGRFYHPLSGDRERCLASWASPADSFYHPHGGAPGAYGAALASRLCQECLPAGLATPRQPPVGV